MAAIRALFVNHKEDHCGVYQHFRRMILPLIDDKDWFYIETNHEWEFDHWANVIQPQVIVYNYYFSGATMPWLSSDKIRRQREKFKQLGIHHEGNMDGMGFDLILHQDPTNVDTRYYNLSRPIPEYTPRGIIPNIPTIGTFGFGLGGKGFTRVVEQVMKEFDAAIIRMNIPFAHFGDIDGNGARWWANACKNIAAANPRIELNIGHSLLPQEQLLDFLEGNTINCFFYDDNKGRGISGTTDYALAVKKPFAITKSDQFQHIWKVDDRMCIENNTLRGIINEGTDYLQPFHDRWNTAQNKKDFENAFDFALKGLLWVTIES